MSKTDQKQTILALDTAMSGVSVGVIAANGHIVSRIVPTARGQAAMLVPMIQEVLGEAQIGFKDIDLIATTRGPGSFTGLRIGLATARSLALALEIPIIGLNTLDVMARHYTVDKPLLVVLESKRTDFYARFYDAQHKPITKSFAAESSEILKRAPSDSFAVGGDCLERFAASVSAYVSVDMELLENWAQPDPILIAQMGKEMFAGEAMTQCTDPLYLRGADVSQSKTPPRILDGQI